MCQGSKFPGLRRVNLFSSRCQGSFVYGRVLNITGFRTCQVHAYASVTQGCEYG